MSLDNVFTWDSTAEKVKTKTCGVELFDTGGNEIAVRDLSDDVEVELLTNQVEEEIPTVVQVDNVEKRDSDLIQHNISFTEPVSGIQLRIKPQSKKHKYQVRSFKIFLKN